MIIKKYINKEQLNNIYNLKDKYNSSIQNYLDKIIHLKKHKEVWKKVMEDLYYTLKCHSCGTKITPQSSVYGDHCLKSCWKYWEPEKDGCAFGKYCKKCKDKSYKPTLANSAHIAMWYGLNPMGNGKKYSKYGVGIDKFYSTH